MGVESASNRETVDDYSDNLTPNREEVSCSICLCDLEISNSSDVITLRSVTSSTPEDSAIRLSCPGGHLYHKGCILRWLRSRRSCPLCRSQVDGEGAVPEFARSVYDAQLFDDRGEYRRNAENDLLLSSALSDPYCWYFLCSTDFSSCFQVCFADIGSCTSGVISCLQTGVQACTADVASICTTFTGEVSNLMTYVGGGCAAGIQGAVKTICGHVHTNKRHAAKTASTHSAGKGSLAGTHGSHAASVALRSHTGAAHGIAHCAMIAPKGVALAVLAMT